MEYRHAVTIVHGRKSYSYIDDLALLAQRKPLAVLLTSSGALFVAWLSTLLSILLVSFVKRFVAIVFLFYAVSREVVIALAVALVSGTYLLLI